MIVWSLLSDILIDYEQGRESKEGKTFLKLLSRIICELCQHPVDFLLLMAPNKNLIKFTNYSSKAIIKHPKNSL